MLRRTLVDAWDRGGRGRQGFEAMAEAYVCFAVENPSHYRVMFSAPLDGAADPELSREGAAAFQVLLDALVEQQATGLVQPDAPLPLARFIWALVHGIAMLAIDGRLPHAKADITTLTRYAIGRAGVTFLRPAVGNAHCTGR
jgi:hypothetical protein